MNREIGMTILHQLGGLNRLSAMIGINTVVLLDDGVKFRFKGSRIANCCEVTLNGWDLYDVTFYRIRGADWITVSEETDIYAEELQSEFISTTGLDLSIGERRHA